MTMRYINPRFIIIIIIINTAGVSRPVQAIEAFGVYVLFFFV